MRTMKDSGVEWIGEIPSDWEICRIAYYTEFINGYAFQSEDLNNEKGCIVIRIGNITSKGLSFDNALRYDEDISSLSNYRIKNNDIIIAMSGATTGKNCLIQNCKEILLINQRVGIIRSNEDTRFISYIVNSDGFYNYIELLSAGSAQPNISGKNILNFNIPNPPLETQQRIADFLDKKCGKIDEIIEREQAVIEKLKEYKQSVITEAVTKGLNPHAEMKDSGIDWIGKIPKDWKVARLKNMCSKISDGTHFSPETTDFGMPYLTAKDIQGDIINYDNACKISKENYYKLVKDKCNPEYGDVLIVKDGATTGRVGIKMDDEPCVILSSVAMLHPKDTITTSYYLRYIMESQAMQEQTQIADYLDNKCAKIDKTIEAKQTVIDKLTEYKKSLIYEVVTGKKEV